MPQDVELDERSISDAELAAAAAPVPAAGPGGDGGSGRGSESGVLGDDDGAVAAHPHAQGMFSASFSQSFKAAVDRGKSTKWYQWHASRQQSRAELRREWQQETQRALGNVEMTADDEKHLEAAMVEVIQDEEDAIRPFWLTNFIIRFPTLMMLLSMIVPVVFSIQAIQYPVKIDYGIESFRVRDHFSAEQYDGYQAARKDTKTFWSDKPVPESLLVEDDGSNDMLFANPFFDKETFTFSSADFPENGFAPMPDRAYPAPVVRGSAPDARQSQTQRRRSVITWRFVLIFHDKRDEDDLLTPEKLEAIKLIEEVVVSQKNYPDFCWSDAEGRCLPYNSLTNYYFPSRVDGQLVNDGGGALRTPIDDVSVGLIADEVFWFTDTDFGVNNLKSKYVRTEFSFATPLAGFDSSKDRKARQEELYTLFITKFINRLDAVNGKYAGVQVSYGGQVITDYILLDTLAHDVTLASVSFAVIFLCVLFHTRSIWLTVMGVFQIILTFPTVYYIYRVIMDVKYVGILNSLSLFIILGIGVDDLFIFTDHYVQTSYIEDIHKRFAYVYKKSACAMGVTSFTTAAAFSANAISEIPAIRLFGAFMALLVVANYVLVMTFYPGAVMFWHKYIVRADSDKTKEKKQKRLSRRMAEEEKRRESPSRFAAFAASARAAIGGVRGRKPADEEAPPATSSRDSLHVNDSDGEQRGVHYDDSDSDDESKKAGGQAAASRSSVKSRFKAFKASAQARAGALRARAMSKGSRGGAIELQDATQVQESGTDTESEAPQTPKPAETSDVEIEVDSDGNPKPPLSRKLSRLGSIGRSMVDLADKKPEDLRAIERFFKYKYAPFLKRWHLLVLLGFVIWFIVAAVVASGMQPSDEAPQFFPSDHNMHRFSNQANFFSTVDNCDDCDAEKKAEVDTCDGQPGSRLDACDICNGDGSTCATQSAVPTLPPPRTESESQSETAPQTGTLTLSSSPSPFTRTRTRTNSISESETESRVFSGTLSRSKSASESRSPFTNSESESDPQSQSRSRSRVFTRTSSPTPTESPTKTRSPEPTLSESPSQSSVIPASQVELVITGDVETFNETAFILELARELGVDPSQIVLHDLYAGSVVIVIVILPSDDEGAPTPDELADQVVDNPPPEVVDATKLDELPPTQPPTLSQSESQSQSQSQSQSRSATRSWSPTKTRSPSRTATRSLSPTKTASESKTEPQTESQSRSQSQSQSQSISDSPSRSPTKSESKTEPQSQTQSQSQSQSRSWTDSQSPSMSQSQSYSAERACDGKPITPEHHPVVDACGKCGGNNDTCCDNTPGYKLDKCQVCNGNNTCLEDAHNFNVYRMYLTFGIRDINRAGVDPNDPFAEFIGVPVFTDDFDMSSREAQEYMLDLCATLYERDDLVQPAKGGCWVESFVTWLESKGYGYPVDPEELVPLVYQFGLERKSFRLYLGFEEDPDGGDPVFRWTAFEFLGRVSQGSSSYEAKPTFDAWRDMIIEQNKLAPEGVQATQTSELWGLMFTEILAVQGVQYGITIAVFTAFFAIFVFTFNIWIAVNVTVTIIGIVVTMVALYVVAGWKLGAVEAISISILVGFSVDYGLHLAGAYAEAGHFMPNSFMDRYERTRRALTSMGISIFMSGVTTIGSSFVLFFTTIVPLQQFGFIVSFNAIFSLIFSMGMLAALLVLWGPERVGGLGKRLRACWGYVRGKAKGKK